MLNERSAAGVALQHADRRTLRHVTYAMSTTAVCLSVCPSETHTEYNIEHNTLYTFSELSQVSLHDMANFILHAVVM